MSISLNTVTFPFNISEWTLIKHRLCALRKSHHSIDVFIELNEIHQIAVGLTQTNSSSKGVFLGLYKFLNDTVDQSERANFYSFILPCIIDRAIAIEELQNHDYLNITHQQQDHSLVISRSIVSSILACMFLCIIPGRSSSKLSKLSTCNFHEFYEHLIGVRASSQIAKLKCFIHYFERLVEQQSHLKGQLIITRRVAKQSDNLTLEDWCFLRDQLCDIRVLTSGQLEDSGSHTMQITFSSKKFGGATLQAGRSQEEVRCCTSPELLVAMLFMESLEDNEALCFEGFETFCECSGYASILEFLGDARDPARRDSNGSLETSLCAIDAFTGPRKKQYERKIVLRELNKCFVGFIQTKKPSVITNINTACKKEIVPTNDLFCSFPFPSKSTCSPGRAAGARRKEFRKQNKNGKHTSGKSPGTSNEHSQHFYNDNYHSYDLSSPYDETFDNNSSVLPIGHDNYFDSRYNSYTTTTCTSDTQIQPDIFASSVSNQAVISSQNFNTSFITSSAHSDPSTISALANSASFISTCSSLNSFSPPTSSVAPYHHPSILSYQQPSFDAGGRRRSSGLSDSSRRSSGSTRHSSSDVSSEFEEVYESFQRESRLRHSAITEEEPSNSFAQDSGFSLISKSAIEYYAHDIVTNAFHDGTVMASEFNSGLPRFSNSSNMCSEINRPCPCWPHNDESTFHSNEPYRSNSANMTDDEKQVDQVNRYVEGIVNVAFSDSHSVIKSSPASEMAAAGAGSSSTFEPYHVRSYADRAARKLREREERQKIEAASNFVERIFEEILEDGRRRSSYPRRRLSTDSAGSGGISASPSSYSRLNPRRGSDMSVEYFPTAAVNSSSSLTSRSDFPNTVNLVMAHSSNSRNHDASSETLRPAPNRRLSLTDEEKANSSNFLSVPSARVGSNSAVGSSSSSGSERSSPHNFGSCSSPSLISSSPSRHSRRGSSDSGSLLHSYGNQETAQDARRDSSDSQNLSQIAALMVTNIIEEARGRVTNQPSTSHDQLLHRSYLNPSSYSTHHRTVDFSEANCHSNTATRSWILRYAESASESIVDSVVGLKPPHPCSTNTPTCSQLASAIVSTAMRSAVVQTSLGVRSTLPLSVNTHPSPLRSPRNRRRTISCRSWSATECHSDSDFFLREFLSAKHDSKPTNTSSGSTDRVRACAARRSSHESASFCTFADELAATSLEGERSREGSRRGSCGFHDTTLSSFAAELINYSLNDVIGGYDDSGSAKKSDRKKSSKFARRSSGPPHFGRSQSESAIRFYRQSSGTMGESSGCDRVRQWLHHNHTTSYNSHDSTRPITEQIEQLVNDLIFSAFDEALIELYDDSSLTPTDHDDVTSRFNYSPHHTANQLMSIAQGITDQALTDAATLIRCEKMRAAGYTLSDEYIHTEPIKRHRAVDQSSSSHLTLCEQSSGGSDTSFYDALDFPYPCLEFLSEDMAVGIMQEALKSVTQELRWNSQYKRNVLEGVRPIATGNWGCGSSGGDPQLKSLLQWAAASKSGTPTLYYYTYGDERMEGFDSVLRKIQSERWNVGQLVTAITNYCTGPCRNKVSLFEHILFPKNNAKE